MTLFGYEPVLFIPPINTPLSNPTDGLEEVAIVVKRKSNIDKGNPASKDNYQVKTLSQLMQDMRVNTKWLTNQASKEVQEMQLIRKKLNQLGDKYGDDAVLAQMHRARVVRRNSRRRLAIKSFQITCGFLLIFVCILTIE